MFVRREEYVPYMMPLYHRQLQAISEWKKRFVDAGSTPNENAFGVTDCQHGFSDAFVDLDIIELRIRRIVCQDQIPSVLQRSAKLVHK